MNITTQYNRNLNFVLCVLSGSRSYLANKLVKSLGLPETLRNSQSYLSKERQITVLVINIVIGYIYGLVKRISLFNINLNSHKIDIDKLQISFVKCRISVLFSKNSRRLNICMKYNNQLKIIERGFFIPHN